MYKKIDVRYRNAIWMAMEKIISIAGVFIVTAAMAKYIGPYYYGVLSLATTSFSMIYIISSMGVDPLVLKKGSYNARQGEMRSILMGIIRTTVFTVLSLLFLLWCWVDGKIHDRVELGLFLAVMISQLLLSVDFIAIINNYMLRSKLNTISNIAGLLTALILRLVFVEMKLHVLWFAIPLIISPLIAVSIKYLTFKRINNMGSVFASMRAKKIKALVGTAVPFAVSSVAANIYNKIPMMIIASVMGYAFSGIYACALIIASTWSFMPTALISSFIPRFYQINKQEKNEDYISLLVTMILLVCTTISIAIWLISPYLIQILYGAKYSDAASIVPIILASTTLGQCGSVVYHILIKTKGYSFIMKKMIASAILSVPLTWFMTVHYGIEGAVMSLLVIEILNLTVFNFMYKKTRVSRILLNSLSPAQIKNLRNI